MELSTAIQGLQDLPDEQLTSLAIAAWQYSGATDVPSKDEDGFPAWPGGTKHITDRKALQALCWEKFQDSPLINTNVRGLVGRLAGNGFEVSSDIYEIQQVIDQTELDPRNRLYNFWPKYVGRSYIEGELFLVLTVHDDGFIEVDFLDPAAIDGGESGDGIIFHPKKTTMPLAYYVSADNEIDEVIPSIFCAYYPELIALAKKTDPGFKIKDIARSRKRAFEKLNGYYRFVVSWDKSFVTHRNLSYLRTVLEWLNLYEMLKKYEIDHKRSAGAYLWVIQVDDVKAFRMWMTLSDEEKRKTGLMAKKTPGGTMLLPPGMKMTAIVPNLPKISDSDTDILHMVTSGLNEAEDVATGQSKGTFASVKASRAPMSDRISDEVAYFSRFLKYDFYRAIFFLKAQVSSFPKTFKVRRAVSFKSKKAVFKEVDLPPEQLIDLSFPSTEMSDLEARVRAYMGVKHGSTNDTLGIPNAMIAKAIGHGNYRKLRLEHETEKDQYPDLMPNPDQEMMQEKVAEPPRNSNKNEPKPAQKPKPDQKAKPRE